MRTEIIGEQVQDIFREVTKTVVGMEYDDSGRLVKSDNVRFVTLAAASTGKLDAQNGDNTYSDIFFIVREEQVRQNSYSAWLGVHREILIYFVVPNIDKEGYWSVPYHEGAVSILLCPPNFFSLVPCPTDKRAENWRWEVLTFWEKLQSAEIVLKRLFKWSEPHWKKF